MDSIAGCPWSQHRTHADTKSSEQRSPALERLAGVGLGWTGDTGTVSALDKDSPQVLLQCSLQESLRSPVLVPVGPNDDS